MYRAGIRELKLTNKRFGERYYVITKRVVGEILQSYLSLYGPDSLVESMAEPYFLDFLLVASGLDELEGDSTLIMGAILKETLNPQSGVAVLGGKSLSRFDVPKELASIAEYFGLSERWVQYLLYCSRMVAKIDSVALQDGYDLYFHMMLLSRSRIWTIIQLSREPYSTNARRYHWFSGNVKSFVDEPHNGILAVEKKPIVLDMTARDSAEARRTSVELLEWEPSKLRRLQTYFRMHKQTKLTQDPNRVEYVTFLTPRGSINWKLLQRLHSSPPRDYEQLLAVHGVGREIVKLLALGSMVYYETSPSFRDPAILAEELVDRYGSAEILWRLQQVVDSINASDLVEAEKRRALARLGDAFGELEGVAG